MDCSKPKAVEQAIELSETKYCSAMASLNAVFEHSYRIVEAEKGLDNPGGFL